MSSSTPDGIWRPAKSFREVPPEWWDYVLDERLWLVTPDTFPFHIEEPEFKLSPMLRTRALYQLGLRNLDRGLVCRNADDRPAKGGVYLRVLPEGVRIGRRPIVTAGAQLAPPVGLIWVPFKPEPEPVPPPQLLRPDFTSLAEALMAARDPRFGMASASALVQRQHPTLTGYLAFCDCETRNWREHPETCSAYPQYPFMEPAIRGLSQSPEEWFQEQIAMDEY